LKAGKPDDDARTVSDFHDAVANALDAINPAECANDFKVCGYGRNNSKPL